MVVSLGRDVYVSRRHFDLYHSDERNGRRTILFVVIWPHHHRGRLDGHDDVFKCLVGDLAEPANRYRVDQSGGIGGPSVTRRGRSGTARRVDLPDQHSVVNSDAVLYGSGKPLRTDGRFLWAVGNARPLLEL